MAFEKKNPGAKISVPRGFHIHEQKKQVFSIALKMLQRSGVSVEIRVAESKEEWNTVELLQTSKIKLKNGQYMQKIKESNVKAKINLEFERGIYCLSNGNSAYIGLSKDRNVASCHRIRRQNRNDNTNIGRHLLQKKTRFHQSEFVAFSSKEMANSFESSAIMALLIGCHFGMKWKRTPRFEDITEIVNERLDYHYAGEHSIVMDVINFFVANFYNGLLCVTVKDDLKDPDIGPGLEQFE